MAELEIFDAIMDSAVLLDKAGRVTNWNSGAHSLFGYSKKEAIGKSINFIYDRNYPFPKIIQELSNQHKKWHEDTIFINKNGVKGHCKSYLSPLLLNDQQKSVCLLMHQNLSSYKSQEKELQTAYEQVSEHLNDLLIGFWHSNSLILDNLNYIQQIERKLSESELRFHLLAENATDVISRHTLSGDYLYVSPACKSSMGYNSEELIGKSIYKLIHQEDQAKIKKIFNRRRENPTSCPIIYRIKKKDGEFRWFESNIRLIMDGRKNIVSEVQLASRDITDRILDKKARLRGQQLAHVFRLSTMEEMASGMAHEISQPLGAIVNYTRGCVRHLENGSEDLGQLRDVMAKAVTQAERAGEIVQRLKNFFCKGQLIKTSCKINNIIRETVSLLKNELNTSKTKIDFDLDKTIPSIFVDKIQTQQVILNLLQNAIEAMQEDNIKEKRIHIQTKTVRTDAIEVTISDSASGFSKDIIQKVFMPFFTTKAHGTGMGLAICRSIIEAHGGQFTINPNTNGKSWIRFSLPTSI